MRHIYEPQLDIDVDATETQIATLAQRVARSWTEMGEREPHWSVVTSERYRLGDIDKRMGEFLARGTKDVWRLRAALRRTGHNLDEIGTALDFGCGVGRLSVALAKAGCNVVAVDISRSHLEIAQSCFRDAGLERVRTVHLRSVEDICGLPEVDLLYSLLVLQHNPPPLMALMLRRLLDRVRKGGLAFFQLPTHCTGYSYDLERDLAEGSGGMEMHVLPQRDVFGILSAAGFVPLEVREDAALGVPDFISNTFLAKRVAPSTPD